MKYNIENIDTKNDFLFFWGHQPSKDGSVTKSCLSQWWLSPFEVDGITYKTAEHWMMAKKALLFDDKIVFKEIIQSIDPSETKKLGRKVQNFDSEIWNSNCFEIVKTGNFHKFEQNKNLKDFLLNTNNKIIVEASPIDAIWGIGMNEKNLNAQNPKTWRGQNLLGFALMEVRDLLKEKK